MSGDADLPAKLGRYELITRIGQGGMADVQLALQRGPAGFEKLVVVKLVHSRLATEKAFVDMLLDEARVAALLKHPNVVDIYDLGEVDGRYFIAMEYLEGEPLLAVLRAGRDGERLDVSSTARLIADTAEGLDAAHELRSMAGKPLELVHHDVSLGNIVVLYNGHVKLVDFGVAKATQSASTRTKVQGKFSYMAPEKLKGAQGDRRSDIFSLGCVLWEALTLRRLFKGSTDDETMKQVLESHIPTPSVANGDVSPVWDPIVMRALERDENKRYASAKELAEDLEAVLLTEGYGRKNTVIASYMQRTFKEHIDARQKLLQEVSSKGSASTEILEAAFIVPIAVGTGTDRGEFSRRYSRPSIPAIVAQGTPAQLDAVPVGDDVDDEPAIDAPMRARTKRYLGAGLLVAMLVGVIAIVHATGDQATPGPPGAKVALAPTVDAAVVPVVADAAPPVAIPTELPTTIDAASAEPIEQIEQIEMGSDHPPTPRPGSGAVVRTPPRAGSGSAAPPSVARQTADELYKQGLQAHIRGDNKSALDLLRRAQKINPSFAATWRVQGLVYERLGEFTQARTAFLQYLKMAPSAPDAASTRTKLEKLGK
ncbi:MAG: protein kinase [Proteobacteria bacterium]|nr:protein kinase [Pseudomonadota bacterium]